MVIAERRNNMDKTLVLEAMYEAISESLEWGLGEKDGSHSYHIDGIVAVVDILLGKLESNDIEKSLESYDDKVLKTANDYVHYDNGENMNDLEYKFKTTITSTNCH